MKKKISLVLACLMIVSLCLLAVGADKTAADSISLPVALVKGHTYQLQFPELSLTVNGQACQGSFVAEGTEAVLVYTDSSGGEVGSYTLPVIDTNNSLDHCAYFYDATGTVGVTENKDDISLTFSEDAEISFVKALCADEFALQLSEQATNYKTLTLKLTDERNGEVSLTFEIDMATKKVSLNGQSAELGDSLRLKYRDFSRLLTDYDGNELFACTQDDNGQPFQGFDGGVYMTLGFRDVTGSSTLCINRLNNQALGHKDGSNADMAEPVISITSALSSRQNMGETFEIPTFTAFDVFSDVAKSSVTVEAPDGTTYTEAFPITQYGRYKVLFTAEDTFGNKGKSNKVVFVNDDIAPTLTVNALAKTAYTLGEAVTIPTYTVSDNMESYRVDVILILPNAEVRLLTSDNTGEVTYALTDLTLYNDTFRVDNTAFRTEQTGTYTLRFVANDEQYNRTVQELSFTVS